MIKMTTKKLIRIDLTLFIVILLLEIFFSLGASASSYIIQFAYNQLAKDILIGFLFFIVSSIFLSFISTLLSSLATYLFSKQTQKYIHYIRDKIVKHYYYNNNSKVAEMENELNSNLQLLNKNYANQLLNIIQSIFLLITSISTLFLMNWSLTLLACILAITTLYIPRFTRKKSSLATKQISNKNSKYLLAIEDWFNGLEELRKYAAFDKLNLVMQKTSRQLENVFVKKQKIISIADFLNGCTNSFSQIAITFLAAILFFNHQVTFGVVIAAGNFSTSILSSLLTITTAMTRMQSVQEINKQIIELQQFNRPSKKPNNEIYSISTHNLSISFQNGETLYYPNLEIKKGEKILLCGDSGVGKSTLFKLILHQIKPTSGQVIFKDKYNRKLEPNYAQIGYIPQDGHLFPVSISDNITMFNASLNSLVKKFAERTRLKKDILSMSNGVETKVDLDKSNFSGGQKQKIILARNEIRNFPIMLADAATSAIDSTNTYHILKNLVSSNQTVIVIAHNLDPITENLFDRKIHLKYER